MSPEETAAQKAQSAPELEKGTSPQTRGFAPGSRRSRFEAPFIRRNSESQLHTSTERLLASGSTAAAGLHQVTGSVPSCHGPLCDIVLLSDFIVDSLLSTGIQAS